VIQASKNPTDQSWEDWGAVTPEQADRYEAAKVNVRGYKRVIVADEVRKVLRDHGEDAIPVTEDDIAKLPEHTANASHVMLSQRAGKLDRIISVTPSKGHTVVVEEIRTGRKKLAFKSLYHHPSKDPKKVIQALRVANRNFKQTAKTDLNQPSSKNVVPRRTKVKPL
jgi:hypothetical protein